MGEKTYHYTDKYYYYYDETLTQTLLNQYVSTINPANSNGTHFVYLNNQGTMSRFTGSRHEPNPEVYSDEADEHVLCRVVAYKIYKSCETYNSSLETADCPLPPGSGSTSALFAVFFHFFYFFPCFL